MTTDGMTSTDARLDGAASDRKLGLTGAIERAEEKVMDFGRSAVTAIDDQREAAAGTMASAAGHLHQSGDKFSEMANNTSEKAAGIAHSAADSLQKGADYIRDHDLKAMVGSVESYVRSNPGKALVVAGVVGFLTARAIRND